MSFNAVILFGAIIGAIFLLIPIKEMKNSYFPIAVTALSAIVMAYSLKGAIPIFNYFNTFYNSDLSVYFKVLVKVLGITLVCNITTDLATEMGMNTLSGKVEFAGKIAVLLSAIPLFDQLFSEIERFI